MNYIIDKLNKFGILESDLDYHLVRASMVILFAFFGYQKWFEYEVPLVELGKDAAMSRRWPATLVRIA